MYQKHLLPIFLYVNKLRTCKGTFLALIAPKGMVSGAPKSHGGFSGAPSFALRLTQTAPLLSPAPEPLRAAPSYVATVQPFARHLGLSHSWQTSSPFVGVSRPAVCTSTVGSAIGLSALVGAILFLPLPLRRLQISCCFYAQSNISPSLQLKSIDVPSFPCSSIVCLNFWIASSYET